MATIIPNQPIVFDLPTSCSSDDSSYIQIVDNTDITQFQIGLDVCSGQAQLLPDPNFSDATEYTLGSNWTISNNTLCHTSGFGSGVSTVYNFDSTSKYYTVSIIVDSISSGSIFNVYFGSTLVGTIQSTGTHTFYGFPAGYFGVTPLIISPSTATDEICISSLNVFWILTNFIFSIYDKNDVFQDSISYENDPSYFTFAEDSLTVTIDWAALNVSDGCYYICMSDPCENTGGQNYPPNITNCSFASSLTGWNAGTSWSYGGSGNAIATYAGDVNDDQIYQDDVFVNYTSTYSIDLIITAITGTIEVYFGTALVGTYTTTGTKVVTGIPVGNLDFSILITSGTVDITSACATALPSSYVCNSESQILKLGDYISDCPETLLINACNNEDGMGFIFDGSGFSPRLRLQAKLKQAKYTSERVVEEDSNGRKRVIYFNGKKSKNLVADLLPEYIHDFLRTLIGYDNFYINDTPYIVDDDEYNVTYDDSQDNVGSITLLISEQTQLIRNTNCSGVENSCVIGSTVGNYLLQANDNSEYITLTTGELITIN